jgi:hypothetical protein
VTATSTQRQRRLRVSIRALVVLVAAIGLSFGAIRHFVPLTPAEAARVARAEMARRDPEFMRTGRVFEVSAEEVNAGRLWSWAYRCDVWMKRNDATTGYLVSINGRNDVKVGRAHDISETHRSWDLPK